MAVKEASGYSTTMIVFRTSIRPKSIQPGIDQLLINAMAGVPPFSNNVTELRTEDNYSSLQVTCTSTWYQQHSITTLSNDFTG
jgi:hypothetical protein